MRDLQKKALMLLVAAGLLVPGMLAAQPSQRDLVPGVPTTDQEQIGEALFYQKCVLCHEWLGRTAAAHSRTRLIGLYQSPRITDEYVRETVLEGFPGRMPSFQYSLTPEELGNLVAYLKIR